MGSKKVFVIGLDGLSFNILNQIKEEYGLVNINNILGQGASGPLKSVLHHSSAPNWASLTTGVNPGKHGYYSFYFPKRNAYEHQFPNATFIKTNRIWDLISKNGKKVLMVNIPATYPPQETNGYMVTGMLTPDINSNFSYPTWLGDEIRKKFPDYTFDTDWKKYKDIGSDQLVDALLKSVKKRRDLFFYLLDKYSIDFAMMVFTETDRLFHSSLHLIDRTHPHFDRQTAERNKGKIVEIFKIIDTSIGKIMKKYLDNGTLILISDHGFSSVLKKFYLNNWLMEQKLFFVRKENVNKSKYLIKLLAKLVLGIFNITGEKRAILQEKLLSTLREKKKLPILDSISKSVIQKVDSMSYYDWSRTKAYFLQEWGIRINLKGREPQGIVEMNDYENLREEIIRSLMGLKDPETNRKIFKKILKRDDVCFGEEFENAPDIFLITEDSPGYELSSDLATKNIFAEIDGKTGEHSLFGMFSMIGENVQKIQLDNISVTDVVPTILYTFGFPVPDYIDGKVITQAFRKEYLERHEIKHESLTINKNSCKKEFVDQEEEKIKDRLKGLGYL